MYDFHQAAELLERSAAEGRWTSLSATRAPAWSPMRLVHEEAFVTGEVLTVDGGYGVARR